MFVADGERGYDEYEAEMLLPLASGMVEGSMFSVHSTKRGKTYLYHIKDPVPSRKELKRAKQWASSAIKVFGWPAQKS